MQLLPCLFGYTDFWFVIEFSVWGTVLCSFIGVLNEGSHTTRQLRGLHLYKVYASSLSQLLTSNKRLNIVKNFIIISMIQLNNINVNYVFSLTSIYLNFSCDCVGILKERNVDVEHRFPEESTGRSKKKSTRCRMVFRTTITNPDGSQETLQVTSQPIVCSKYYCTSL